MINDTLKTKLANLEKDGTVSHERYDRLLRQHFAGFLGGNIKKLLTASVPLSKDVMNFFKVAFSA